MSGAKCAVLLAALIVGPAMACASEPGSTPVKNLATHEKLESHMDVDFQATTLRELLDFFRRRLVIDIVLDNSSSALADKADHSAVEGCQRTGRPDLGAEAGRAAIYAYRRDCVRGRPAARDEMEPMSLRQYDVADLLIPTTALTTNSNTNTLIRAALWPA